MAEGEPTPSQAQAEIDAHLAARAEKGRQDLLDELLIGDGVHQESYKRAQVVNRKDGTSYERAVEVKGKPLNREEQGHRIEEATEYYKHLEGLAGRSSNHDDYEQRLLETAHEEALAENADRDAADADFQERLNSDPRSRRLQMIAEDIANRRNHVVSDGDDEAELQRILADKEQNFQELFDRYEAEGMDHDVLEHILNGVYVGNTATGSTEQGVVSGSSTTEAGGETGGTGEADETEAVLGGIEFERGDEVEYTNRNGETIRGVIVDELDLDNEDYRVFIVDTPNGRKPVSFAKLVESQGALPVIPGEVGSEVPAKEGQSQEEYEAENNTTGAAEDEDEVPARNPGDIVFPDGSGAETGGDGPETGELEPKSKWEKFKDLFRPSYWGAVWTEKIASRNDRRDEKRAAMTPEEKEKEDKRTRVLKVLGIVGAGVATGVVGTLVVRGIIDSQTAEAASKSLDKAAEASALGWTIPDTFPIESGDGMTQGMQNALQAAGHDLSPEGYSDLHNHLTTTLGPEYLINDGHPSNHMEVDPNTTWIPGAREEAEQWIAEHPEALIR